MGNLNGKDSVAMSGIVTAESCWLNYRYWNFAVFKRKPTV